MIVLVNRNMKIRSVPSVSPVSFVVAELPVIPALTTQKKRKCVDDDENIIQPSKRPVKFSRPLNRRLCVMLEQLRGREMLSNEHIDHSQAELMVSKQCQLSLRIVQLMLKHQTRHGCKWCTFLNDSTGS
ncbi:hypothetical protein LSH36_22g08010 [Paralvinella palmiformis]|uniref:Uncharacterized protein n=1 Tax=Paralvinella palmiformis TaxID=53620 RepID=A0AAD9NH02_9ANNE|nr:hypothetical protein LSH36_22g08010 [Paralvinella palmiformis]